MLNWQVVHYALMSKFLEQLFKHTNNFILKGGASLMLCYGLNRFSDNIDLDGFDSKFLDIVDKVADDLKVEGYYISYQVTQNTDDVKQILIYYGLTRVLKVNVSYRFQFIPTDRCTWINGMLTYKIDNIMTMKINTFSSHEKMRDLFDITYIYNNYKDNLSEVNIIALTHLLAFRGIEKLECLIKEQTDEMIDNNVLLKDFLKMYNDLGLQ
jgi:predicted nucleotidyltransferase component of viral defense system